MKFELFFQGASPAKLIKTTSQRFLWKDRSLVLFKVLQETFFDQQNNFVH